MPNPHRSTSRSASIPIPGATGAGRSIEDILNFNALGQLSPTSPASPISISGIGVNMGSPSVPAISGGSGTPMPLPMSPTASGHRERSQSQHYPTRNMYSGLEASRPMGLGAVRHVSTSVLSSPTVSHLSAYSSLRNALGSGSSQPWGSRVVSASSAVSASGMVGSPSTIEAAGNVDGGGDGDGGGGTSSPRSVVGFEPRVVRGPGTETGGSSNSRPASEQQGSLPHGVSVPRSPTQRRDSYSSTSPTRSYRTTTGGSTRALVSRSIPVSSHHTSSPTRAATASGTVSSSLIYRTNTGTGAPTTFKRPSYLQYSAMRDLIHTDTSAPPVTAIPRTTIRIESTPGQEVHLPPVRDPTPITESDDDSESSTGHAMRHRRDRHEHTARERGRLRERHSAYNASQPLAPSEEILRLPSRWNEQDRNKFLTISEDGRNLHFHGPTSQGEKEAAAARANHHIPPACGIYYYEVTIIDKGFKGHISIGFSGPDVRLNRLPGWEKDSWGYHGDDGNSFASQNDGTSFGPKFTTGDVIGCGIDFALYKAFYTKNGTMLGYAFDNVGRELQLYPAVGLRTSNEGIRVNFGHEKFKYDIDYHVHCARERTWSKILTTPITWSVDDANDVFTLQVDKLSASEGSVSGVGGPGVKSESGTNSSKTMKQESIDDGFEPIHLPPDYSEPINKLVMSYLIHHGYEKTANAFMAQNEAKKRKISDSISMFPMGKLPLRKREDVDIDIKMESDDYFPGPRPDEYDTPFYLEDFEAPDNRINVLQSRQRIVNALLAGDIDLAIGLTKEQFPSVLELNDGMVLLRMRCQKFVELMLCASDASRTRKRECEAKEPDRLLGPKDNGMMEVDESLYLPTNGYANSGALIVPNPCVPFVGDPQAMKHIPSKHHPSSAILEYQSALSKALDYGRRLQSDYKADPRPEVSTLLKKTFSLTAYDDPLEAGGEVAELASQDARSRLAQEVNQAILESQGRPSRPALERLYRQTAVTLTCLALSGVGEAAFADMEKEFLG